MSGRIGTLGLLPCFAVLVASMVGAVALASPVPAFVVQEKQQPAGATQEEIDHAIDRGLDFLLSRQALDGSWGADEHRYIAGQTGLCVYTLIKGGLPATHPAVQRGLAFIRAHPPRFTYGLAVCTLAVCAASPTADQGLVEDWTEQLLDARGRGFTYPGGHEDLSLTQYGCLALRAAAKRGVEISPRVWRQIIDFTSRLQKDDAGFSYTPAQPVTQSMTAAGIAALVIARDELERSSKLKKREAREIEEAIGSGVEWLGQHLEVERNVIPSNPNPKAAAATRWHLYSLYGLERVGGLLGLERFGPHDWYAQAATHLVKTQDEATGKWSSPYGEAHPSTCFAVLVLRRATAPTSGKSNARIRRYGADDPEQPVSILITGDSPLVAWVSSFGTAALAENAWDGKIDEGLRVTRVEYIDVATGAVLAEVPGNPEQPSGAERFAARIQMQSPGAYTLSARVWVVPPGADGSGAHASEAVALEAAPLEVRVDGVMTPGMRRAMDELELNLLPRTRVEVTASSIHGGAFKAEQAADGIGSYGWLCNKSDLAPWLQLDLQRPQRGNIIALTPFYRSQGGREEWGGPKRVEVRVNKRLQASVELDPAHDGKVYVELPKRVSIRRIRLDIIEKRPGTRPSERDLCGFAEVELFDRK